VVDHPLAHLIRNKMTKILNVRDANTGHIIPVDLDNPSGTLYVNDDDTGGLVPVVLGGSGSSIPVGSIVDAVSNPDPTKYLQMNGQWVVRSAWPALSALIPASQPLAPWEFGTLPSSQIWSKLAWNGSIFCIVTNSLGTVAATSSDGLAWSQQTMARSATWVDITWDGTVFCAVASSPYANVSTNGVSWSDSTMASNSSWKCVASNGSRLVAVATGTTAGGYSDNHGSSWTAMDTGISDSWVDLVWNGSIFCLAGGGGTVLISSNGINWTNVTLANTVYTIKGLAWNGSVFCATCGTTFGQAMLVSSDGTNWRVLSNPLLSTTSLISSHGDRFIVYHANGAGYLSNADATSWEFFALPITNSTFELVSSGNYLVGAASTTATTRSMRSAYDTVNMYIPHRNPGSVLLKSFIRASI